MTSLGGGDLARGVLLGVRWEEVVPDVLPYGGLCVVDEEVGECDYGWKSGYRGQGVLEGRTVGLCAVEEEEHRG